MLLNLPLVLADQNVGFLELINRVRIVPQGAVSTAHVSVGIGIARLKFNDLLILVDGFAELALHIEHVADVLFDARSNGIKLVSELQFREAFVRLSSGVEAKSVAIVRHGTFRVELDCMAK